MRIWIFVILLPLIAGAAFIFYAPFCPEVAVFSVKKGCAIDAVMGTATILPKEDIILYATVEGKIAQLAFSPSNPWQVVHKDQVLVEWDKSEVESMVERLEKDRQWVETKQQTPSLYAIEMEAIQRELVDAKRQSMQDAYLQKIEKLNQDNARLEALAKQEAMQYQERLNIINADLQALYKKREAMTIKSPIKGLTTAVYAVEGDWVKPGDPLMQIISEEKWIQASLDEGDAQGVAPGQIATLYLSQHPQNALQGRVKAVAPVADPNTRRRMVVIEADLNQQDFVSGTTGQVSIAKSERKESLLVPRRALLDNQLVVINDGHIHFQPVQVGFRGLHYAEILGGVAEGQLVVVDNLHLYREGQKIKIGKSL
jgi:RND family efflux transporter MFP subunit